MFCTLNFVVNFLGDYVQMVGSDVIFVTETFDGSLEFLIVDLAEAKLSFNIVEVLVVC